MPISSQAKPGWRGGWGTHKNETALSQRRFFFYTLAGKFVWRWLAGGCILTLSLGRYGWPNLPFGPDRRDALSYLGGGAAA